MVEIHDISPSTDKGNNGTDHNIDIPSKGRVFDDNDDIYNFYKEYAKKLRFPIVSFGCARGGKHQRKAVNPRGSMETGCGAYITCRMRGWEMGYLWHWMLVEYGLQDIQWLKDLFEERSRWGSNVFLDGYIDARSSIKQLVEQYEVALRKNVETEKLADDASSLKTIPL
ncbi:hypothetical protein MKW92_053355, partial [Papaver armeniacum]